jgi:hypothetical protein
MMEVHYQKNNRVPVKGGGVCIYCGWDGGEDRLRDEHIVPYSLGGNVELIGASCIRCEGVTSYVDGYLANAVFKHFRVHVGLPSRRGHPRTLSVTIEQDGTPRVFDLATKDHPYFLNMPIWRPPGITIGAQMSEWFVGADYHKYWYLPPNLEAIIGANDAEITRVMDTSPPVNFATFARGLAKIAYCDAVMRYGLDGFRPLAVPDIILGNYTCIAHFVGSESRLPLPPYRPGFPHSVAGGTITYGRLKLLTSIIRLFGDSGTKEHGMPFYMVIVGAEGRRKIIPRQPSPRLPRSILL